MSQGSRRAKSHENIDIAGNKWRLATGGYRIVHRCQADLSRTQAELKGYSALFKRLGRCEMEDGELYGMGITLERLSSRLLRLSDRLSSAIRIEDVDRN